MLAALLTSLAATASTPQVPLGPTAAVGLAGVLLGAVIAGGFRITGDRLGRLAEAHRDALHGLQDSCLELRMALAAYGAGMPFPSRELTRELDRTTAAFDVQLQRVDFIEARISAGDWRQEAEAFWLKSEESNAEAENLVWSRHNYVVGQTLRGVDRGTGKWLSAQPNTLRRG